MRPLTCSALKTRTHLVERFAPGKGYRQAIGVKRVTLLALIKLSASAAPPMTIIRNGSITRELSRLFINHGEVFV
jgi:hypothetical protein